MSAHAEKRTKKQQRNNTSTHLVEHHSELVEKTSEVKIQSNRYCFRMLFKQIMIGNNDGYFSNNSCVAYNDGRSIQQRGDFRRRKVVYVWRSEMKN